MRKSIVLIGILALFLISGCAQDQISQTGILEGTVAIGPLCPVERVPPDPNCMPTEDTYKAWSIAIYPSNSKAAVAHIIPELDGSYKVELPVGRYTVNLENQPAMGKNNLPATITISNQQTTRLDIAIDTGIR